MATQSPARLKRTAAKLGDLGTAPPAYQFGESGKPVTVFETPTGGLSYLIPGTDQKLVFVAPWKADGWAACMNECIAQANAAGGGVVIVPPSIYDYVAEVEISLSGVTDVTVLHYPGITIKRPDPFTVTGTVASGSTALSVSGANVSKLLSGYGHGQYIVNDAAPTTLPIDAYAQVVAGNVVTLPSAATGAITNGTLTCHYKHNIYRVQGSTNCAVISPYGQSTLDANGLASPLTFDSADDLRNCIRVHSTAGFKMIGLTLKDPHYHGCIITNGSGELVIDGVKAINAGFRGIHMHGDPGLAPCIDLFIDQVHLDYCGRHAMTIKSDVNSGGLFLAFDNVRRLQFGRVKVTNDYACGVMFTGAAGGGTEGDLMLASQIITEHCANGIQTLKMSYAPSIAQYQSSGDVIEITAAAMSTAAPVQLPMWSAARTYVASAKMQSMTLPVGTDMTKIRRGHYVHLPNYTGNADTGVTQYSMLGKIWSVDANTRTIYVYNSKDETKKVYNEATTAGGGIGDTTQDIRIWTAGQPYYVYAETTDDTKHIQIGQFIARNTAGNAFSTAGGTFGQPRVQSVQIGEMLLDGCGDGAIVNSIRSAHIGSFVSSGVGYRRNCATNDGNAIDLKVTDTLATTICAFTAIADARVQRNNAALLSVASYAKNTKIFSISAQNTNGSAFAVQADGTAVDGVLFGDPRKADGTALMPTIGTATNVSTFRYGLA